MKKILALTLAAAACFALLTGCGSSASSNKSTGASAAASQFVAASTPRSAGMPLMHLSAFCPVFCILLERLFVCFAVWAAKA